MAPVAELEGAWELPGKETTGEFSAVGYFYARQLALLLNVPVGIINSTKGGSPVESWLCAKDLADSTYGPAVSARWARTIAAYPEAKAAYDQAYAIWSTKREDAVTTGKRYTVRPPLLPFGPGHHHTPSVLYNGMIAPLLPYAIRGFIWYQGEANANRSPFPEEYHDLFASMIRSWRRQFDQGELPFYWVQIAGFAAGDPDGTKWARIREGQAQALSLPATGQAVTLDISNAEDVHPRNKRDVGLRLARIALHRTYGMDLIDSGPILREARREGSGFRLRFLHAEGGLVAPLPGWMGFELAGKDKVFKMADAIVEGDSILTQSRAVLDPVAVRYAWRNAPVAGLFNIAGLPAAPFRTDDWP